jgi:hypothetical protein
MSRILKVTDEKKGRIRSRILTRGFGSLQKMSRIRNSGGFIYVVSSYVYSRGLVGSFQFLNSAVFGPIITKERLVLEPFFLKLGSKYFGLWINIFPVYFFGRARMCWPLLCLCRPFCIFERCLDSNPESCRSKQACFYQPSYPSPYE